MNSVMEILKNCVRQIREKTDFAPEIALTLGSGLGSFAERMTAEAVIDYRDIDGMPVPSVEDHAGRFIFGYMENVPAVILQGRVHYYEGFSPEEAVRPTRIAGLLGAKKLILTNASGAINESFVPGDLMLVRDHIMLHVPSPLRGEAIPELGERFPDMSEVYDRGLSDLILSTSNDIGLKLREGVYIQTSGPNYETRAEARMFRLWGADAVGMSTACEAIAAHQMGMRVAALSVVTCIPTDKMTEALTDEAVQAAAGKAEADLGRLLLRAVPKLYKA